MDFNPDPKKQAIEVCFSRKIVSNNVSPLSLNQSQAKISESHKHLQPFTKYLRLTLVSM